MEFTIQSDDKKAFLTFYIEEKPFNVSVQVIVNVGDSSNTYYLTTNEVLLIKNALPGADTIEDRNNELEIVTRYLSLVKQDDEEEKILDRLYGGAVEDKEERPDAEVFIGLPQKDIDLFTIEQVQNAAGEFMEAMGFELKTQDEPIYGSFFQWLQFWRKPEVKSEVGDLYKKGKDALEAQYLGLPSAERTEKLANAAANVITALGPVNEGVLRLGGILIVKVTRNGLPSISAETISPELANLLDKNPIMLKNPNLVFDMIASMQVPSTQIEEGGSAEVVE